MQISSCFVNVNLVRLFLCVFCFPFLLLACAEEVKKEAPAPIRHIKTITLKPRAANQSRVIAGVVAPTVSSNVAFEVSGQIKKLSFSVGDFVNKGDVLAQLDRQTYELNVQSAKGNLQSAKANLIDAQKKFDQQNTLYQKKFTTKTNFDSAVATLESAKSQVSIRESELAIAKRDLNKTVLVAPFSGSISEKQAEVFEEVTTGKTIAVLDSVGDYEVDVSLPETLVNQVKVSDPVEVKISLYDARILKGYVKEIGSRAGDVNSYPVKIWLTSEANELKQLRAGMSVEVTFRFAEPQGGDDIFYVPTSAVITSGEKDKSYAYVFNKEKQIVERRVVTVVNIENNDLMIRGDIKAGDILASAGLSFLVDKMPVRLLAKQ